MKVAFYLVAQRKKNLYCRISDGKERILFSLDYATDVQKWNAKKEELDLDDIHYFTLSSFRNHLTKKYFSLKAEGKSDILAILKNESELLMDNNGLDGIAKALFDLENKEAGIPLYEDFLKAFEKYTGLVKGFYKVQPLDESIHFHTEDEEYVMDTYEGLQARLKGYLERKSYVEICTQTESWIWGEIYTDAGIEKSKFMPRMLLAWEIFWSEKYEDVKAKVGHTNHLDERKARSWRTFQVFMECYDDSADIIELAVDIDDMNLYPLAVITMLEIFDADTCYQEYCEHEFERGEWKAITLDDDDNSSVFFIKPYDI
ncbi:MAG: hypothetical protein V4649_08285 [Bacteroidota bacterium]